MAVRKVNNMGVGTKEWAFSVINLTIRFVGLESQFTGEKSGRVWSCQGALVGVGGPGC